MENEVLLFFSFYDRFYQLPHFLSRQVLHIFDAIPISGTISKGRMIPIFHAINFLPDIRTNLTKTNKSWLILPKVKSRFQVFVVKSY